VVILQIMTGCGKVSLVDVAELNGCVDVQGIVYQKSGVQNSSTRADWISQTRPGIHRHFVRRYSTEYIYVPVTGTETASRRIASRTVVDHRHGVYA
jgi:hypothetical protein